jgi:hypothetical protein
MRGLKKKEQLPVHSEKTADEEAEIFAERAEKGRHEVLYLALALILILGIGVIVYAFNIEMLNGLFKSDYFNNMIRISLSLLILAFIGWLAYREKGYSRQSNLIFNELKNSSKALLLYWRYPSL